MFKLAVFAALLALAVAAPGGLTGLSFDHGLGHIHAPQVIAHAPVHHVAPVVHAVHAVHQPIAPHVHTAPIVTKTVLPDHHSHPIVTYAGHGVHAPLAVGHGHGHGLGLGLGHY